MTSSKMTRQEELGRGQRWKGGWRAAGASERVSHTVSFATERNCTAAICARGHVRHFDGGLPVQQSRTDASRQRETHLPTKETTILLTLFLTCVM